MGGSYWRDHLTQAIKPAESLSALVELNTEILLETGPDLLETTCGPTSWRDESVEVLATLDGDRDATTTLLNALGRLYVSGINPDVAAFTSRASGRRIRLPHYPFQKQRYWITEVAQYGESVQTVNQ